MHRDCKTLLDNRKISKHARIPHGVQLLRTAGENVGSDSTAPVLRAREQAEGAVFVHCGRVVESGIVSNLQTDQQTANVSTDGILVLADNLVPKTEERTKKSHEQLFPSIFDITRFQNPFSASFFPLPPVPFVYNKN